MGTKKNFLDANGNIIEDLLCVEEDSHGLMCPEDKVKLAGIETGANKYTHPTYTTRTGVPTTDATLSHGGKFTVTQPVSDSTGHITAMNTRTYTLPNETHYTAIPHAGSSSSIGSTSTENGNTYINIVENGTRSGGVNIKGSGATTVTSDSDGAITVKSTEYSLSSFDITASPTELNYNDGVHSNIQEQLDDKVNLTSEQNISGIKTFENGMFIGGIQLIHDTEEGALRIVFSDNNSSEETTQ